ncbi:putative arginine N-methyltransferase [Podospora australis]|uniref:Arginine N-methyltransferase 2 n=1 Tax=Podospora australis TaxID=1536484 RepID=A0AAN7AL65_9PEZI|nr:putative arginine N-methyltransferase [Podospora australis]
MILLDSERDAISARISESCPPETQRVLTAAWAHDVEAVKKLLDTPERARCQDPLTGETPLHAAIRSCGPPSDDDDAADLEAAKETVHELLLWGGIWNDVDDRNETPGCVAHRLGRTELYNLCVEAGVRAEMLFGVLEGYEELESGDEAEEEEDEDEDAHRPNEDAEMVIVGEDGEDAPELVTAVENGAAEETEKTFQPPTNEAGVDVNSEAYLRSKLTYSEGKLVDDEGNGVMMAWETDIMRQSVDALLPGKESGKRILNIGFGMGIIDTMFAETKPAKHHIVEAHPEVIEHTSSPDSKFGANWEASAPEPGAYKIYQGKWQEVCVQLLQEGHVYDAIYFDTFGEDYSQLRLFFTELVPGLMDSNGTFSFFNGLGADRAICYDVYTKVSELHLTDAGLDVEWKVIDVDMSQLAEAGEGEWEGVRRRYWTLDKYRLPICKFLG